MLSFWWNSKWLIKVNTVERPWWNMASTSLTTKHFWDYGSNIRVYDNNYNAHLPEIISQGSLTWKLSVLLLSYFVKFDFNFYRQNNKCEADVRTLFFVIFFLGRVCEIPVENLRTFGSMRFRAEFCSLCMHMHTYGLVDSLKRRSTSFQKVRKITLPWLWWCY